MQKYCIQTTESTMLIGTRDLILFSSAAARTKLKLQSVTITLVHFSVVLFGGHARSQLRVFHITNHHYSPVKNISTFLLLVVPSLQFLFLSSILGLNYHSGIGSR